MLPLPRPPPSEALRRAQEERAKHAKKRGQAINRNTDAEKAARDAAARKAPSDEPKIKAKVGASSKDENNNDKVHPPVS